MSTDVSEFITDLGAGVFEQKISKALSAVAAGVVDHEAEGAVNIKIKIKPIGAYQVEVKHTLEYTTPKKRGKLTETDETKTPMHVGTAGKMSFFPEKQDQLFTKQGKPNTNKEG